MSITTIPVEEAHCHICGHTWIIRDPKDQECPECRRRSSKVTHGWKHRCLCIQCHTVWMRDYKSDEPEQCPKCQLTNVEGKKKNISTDIVNEYVCGSCDNIWISDIMANKGDQYCKKCGCGREDALKTKTEEEQKNRRMYGGGWTSYRGHAQSINPATGEWEPSKEEIDAKIAVGILRDKSNDIQVYNSRG
jgi:hypothetical protein